MLKVGEVAKRSGLTVRTLHHYDDIGLLSPTRRSVSGHRLYDTPEIARLQQIKSLQQLGFSLPEIADVLRGERSSAQRVVDMHLQRAREELDHQRTLVDRLEQISTHLTRSEQPSTDLLLATIEAMNMFENYYSPDQMKQFAERREEVGEGRIAAVQQEWQQLYADAQDAMERGVDPAHPSVQKLVDKSRVLIEEFTGGDDDIRESLGRMWKQEPKVQQQWGPPPEVADYLRRASAAADRDG